MTDNQDSLSSFGENFDSPQRRNSNDLDRDPYAPASFDRKFRPRTDTLDSM